MRLREALSVLSKSSPYAVSTERDNGISHALDAVKDYLYVQTDIEIDFRSELTKLSPSDKKIIFLCGSSGDGKSEILTRYSRDFSNRADFHLDATHSFRPDATAIQTLDELFLQFESESRPLVVGINTGMLGNYAEEGSVDVIKQSIKSFLNNEPVASNHIFLDFEQYPKFILEESGHTSKFAKMLLKRITATEDNIIRQIFDKEKQNDTCDTQLCANYDLLSIEEVQDVIIDVLFKARLMKDQFLTARALLDFIFHLVAGPAYLFDNLFSGADNELASKVIEFDPANIRTKNLDKFILSQSLQLKDSEFETYLQHLNNIGINKVLEPQSYLRLFYLIRKADLANNYHTYFIEDFKEQLIDTYSNIWHLHADYNGSTEQKATIRKFYREVALAAIHKYNNRNAPELDKNAFLVSEHNGFQLAAEIEIKADLKEIRIDNEKQSTHFNAYFKIGEKTKKLQININLLGLMQRIVEGYRPNKHDKNTVVLLDELVEEITEIANTTNTLLIVKGSQRIKINNIDDEEFEVSGI